MLYCPHCEQKIEGLKYCCSYSEYGTEIGTCNTDGEDCESNNWDSDNHETSEYTFYCPNCDEKVMPEDLLEELPNNLEPSNPKEDNEKISIMESETIFQTGRITKEKIRIAQDTIECPACHKQNLIEADDETTSQARPKLRGFICHFCHQEITN
jgi:hypothetical protein